MHQAFSLNGNMMIELPYEKKKETGDKHSIWKWSSSIDDLCTNPNALINLI